MQEPQVSQTGPHMPGAEAWGDGAATLALPTRPVGISSKPPSGTLVIPLPLPPAPPVTARAGVAGRGIPTCGLPGKGGDQIPEDEEQGGPPAGPSSAGPSSARPPPPPNECEKGAPMAGGDKPRLGFCGGREFWCRKRVLLVAVALLLLVGAAAAVGAVLAGKSSGELPAGASAAVSLPYA